MTKRKILNLRVWRDWLHFSSRDFLLIITPAHLSVSVRKGNHGDALIHRADERAKVTTNALALFDLGNGFARDSAGTQAVPIRIDEGDRLMRAVFTRDVAKIAADTFVVIDLCDAFVIQIERFPFLERGNSLADKIHHALESF